MKKHIRGIIAFGMALLVSGVFGLPILASESREDDPLPTPVTEAKEEISAPTYRAPPVPVTNDPVTQNPVETSREPVVIPPPETEKIPNAPDDKDDDRGWFSGMFDGLRTFISNLIDGVSSGITDLGTSISKLFDSLTELPTKFWDALLNSLIGWIKIGSGEQGLMEILKDGGQIYVSNRLNKTIDAFYDIFYIPGIVIMVICFCYSMFHGCYSLELGDKSSIIKPLIGMIITLFAFTLSKDIMSALYQISIEMTEKIVNAAARAGVNILFDSLTAKPIEKLGYAFINGILQLILMLNIAKIALLQATAPMYIGFAPAEKTRRIMLNLLKEYGKCCLVPPITAAYAIITFCISSSTLGLFASIVIGISIWSAAGKHLDKILN